MFDYLQRRPELREVGVLLTFEPQRTDGVYCQYIRDGVGLLDAFPKLIALEAAGTVRADKVFLVDYA